MFSSDPSRETLVEAAFGDRFAPMMLHLDRQGIPQFALDGCSKISVLKHNTNGLKANYGAQFFHHDGWGHAPIDPCLSMLMAAAMPVTGGSTFIADAKDVLDVSERELWRLTATVNMHTGKFIENPMLL